MSPNTIRVSGPILSPEWLELDHLVSVADQTSREFGLKDDRSIDAEASQALGELWTVLSSNDDLLDVTIRLDPFSASLFGSLGYSLTPLDSPVMSGGRQFPISHRAGLGDSALPMMTVPRDVELDRRQPDGSRSVQATMQEYLNLSDQVWGLVFNGRKVRLLRATSSLSSTQYVEFDVENVVRQNLEYEFEAMFRLLHASRLPENNYRSDEAPIEKYHQESLVEFGRVREGLRTGVEEAVRILGNGFLTNPASEHLRRLTENGALDEREYFRQLLTLMYRFIMLVVSEERGVLQAPGRTDSRYEIYRRHYGMDGLRERANSSRPIDDAGDLWRGLVKLFRALNSDEQAKLLGVTPLGGRLFSDESCELLESAGCSNGELLDAIEAFTTFESRRTRSRRWVNFSSLNVEELGSVYESLLEYRPNIDSEHLNFGLSAGGERKETGSYYTPPSLVDQLIETALVPVMEDRLGGVKTTSEKERALLRIRVIDPASGSGHFILAAGRRLADALVDIRHGTREPTRAERQTALRDVIRRCLYAVDNNPLAVDLCMFSLWLEGQSSGAPLTFLDSHIMCADSLIGVLGLEVLKQGIPDGALNPVEGDDRDYARSLAQTNKSERSSRGTQVRLGEEIEIDSDPDLIGVLDGLTATDAVDLADLRTKRGRLRALRNEERYRSIQSACDAWTGAFFTRLDGTTLVPTSGHVFRSLRGGDVGLELGSDFRPMHWPLMFPEVSADGGFDVVLGNPPWERIKLQEREFFAGRHAAIEGASTAALRRRLIANLDDEDPDLATEYHKAKHNSDCTGKFLRESGRFPLGAKGDINTYAVFAELMRDLVRPSGRAGFIVPSGLATDHPTKDLFASLVDSGRLVSLYDFENRRGIFTGVHRSYKFSLVTLSGPDDGVETADFAFFLLGTQDLADDDKHFRLGPDDFKLINPNTRTCPIFRSARDAEITRKVHRNVPVLDADDPGPGGNTWDARFGTMFHTAGDSGLFRTLDDLSSEPGFARHGNVVVTDSGRYLPLFEGKMVDSYDHRSASVLMTKNLKRPGQPLRTSESQHQDLDYSPTPQFWILAQETGLDRAKDWLLAIKRITSSTNARTVVASALPPVALADSMIRISLPGDHPVAKAFLIAVLNSIAFDYLVRQKLGGLNLNYFILKQIPMPGRSTIETEPAWAAGQTVGSWIAERVRELCCVSSDMKVMARSFGSGPEIYRWDPQRRLVLRCELDAAMFRLYGMDRSEAEFVLDTFPIVRRNDEAEYGEFRTKRFILERFDDFDAAETGTELRLGSA
jgi:hypothetical protein